MRNKKHLLCALLLCACLITGCGAAGDNGRKINIVLNSGMKDADVFTVNYEEKTRHASEMELRIILDDLCGEYDKALGSDVMNSEDGVSIREHIRDDALAKLSRMKALDLMAEERGISLSKDEEEAADKKALDYVSALSSEQRAYLTAGSSETAENLEDTAKDLMRQYAVSEKVYEDIISGVRTEVSDDEARTLTAQAILFSTTNPDGSAMSEAEKEAVYDEASECMDRILSGDGTPFSTLIAEYSDSDVNSFSICRNGTEDSFLVNGEVSDGDTTPLAKTAFQLTENEKSGIITTDAGYRIVKCLSTFDEEQTNENKRLILKRERQEAFEEAYDSYAQNLDTEMNSKLWNSIPLPEKSATGTLFFEAAGNEE